MCFEYSGCNLVWTRFGPLDCAHCQGRSWTAYYISQMCVEYESSFNVTAHSRNRNSCSSLYRAFHPIPNHTHIIMIHNNHFT